MKKVNPFLSRRNLLKLGAALAISPAAQAFTSIRASRMGKRRLTTFTYVDVTIGLSANGDPATMLVPATAQKDDLCIVFNAVGSTISMPTTVVPSGFTSLVNSTVSPGYDYRSILSVKKLDGSERGTSLVGMDSGGGTSDWRYTVLILRPNGYYSTIIPSTFNGQGTAGDPAAQTITSASSPSSPVVAIAHYYKTSGTITTDTQSPAMTETGSPRALAFYKIYSLGDTLSNHTIDMNDESHQIMQSGYLRFG